MATLLGPEYTYVLSDDLVEEGTCYLKEIVGNFVDNHLKKPIESSNDTATSTTEEQIEPPLKKFIKDSF